MKKVLSLALAAVMVCTMAFAVSTGTENDYTGATGPAKDIYMQAIVPGQSIVFSQEELGLTAENWGKTNGEFDPKKNNVELTITTGSELIASKGWVQTDADTYKYVVTTKSNESSVLDNNADIIISAIKVTIYGVSKPAMNAQYTKEVGGVTNYVYVDSLEALASFQAKDPGENFCPMNQKSEEHILAMCFDYGRKANEDNAVFGEGGLVVTDIDTTGKTLYTVKAATVGSQYVTSGSWTQSVTEGKGGQITVSAALKAGDKVYFGKVNFTEMSATARKALEANLAKAGASVVASYGYEDEQTIISRGASIVIDGMKANNYVYMVKADGSVVNLGAKFDAKTGLLSASTTMTGPVIVTDKPITATSQNSGGSSSGSTGSTGNSGNAQNPNTGSASFVGAAMTLAVVSGIGAAAVSLKKK